MDVTKYGPWVLIAGGAEGVGESFRRRPRRGAAGPVHVMRGNERQAQAHNDPDRAKVVLGAGQGMPQQLIGLADENDR